MKELES